MENKDYERGLIDGNNQGYFKGRSDMKKEILEKIDNILIKHDSGVYRSMIFPSELLDLKQEISNE
jgi:hypothetical protein